MAMAPALLPLFQMHGSSSVLLVVVLDTHLQKLGPCPKENSHVSKMSLYV